MTFGRSRMQPRSMSESVVAPRLPHLRCPSCPGAGSVTLNATPQLRQFTRSFDE